MQRTTAPAASEPEAVIGRDDILELQAMVPRVPAAPHVVAHAVAIARASRPGESTLSAVKDYVAFGAGPRASQALVIGAKARAILHGRFAAEIEDVRALAGPVMRHRLVSTFRAEAEGVKPSQVIAAILDSVAT